MTTSLLFQSNYYWKQPEGAFFIIHAEAGLVVSIQLLLEAARRRAFQRAIMGRVGRFNPTITGSSPKAIECLLLGGRQLRFQSNYYWKQPEGDVSVFDVVMFALVSIQLLLEAARRREGGTIDTATSQRFNPTITGSSPKAYRPIPFSTRIKKFQSNYYWKQPEGLRSINRS